MVPSPSDEDQPVAVRRSGGLPYVLVAVHVLRDPSLPAPARLLYTLLCTYAGFDDRTCWPIRRTLAAQMGCSLNTLDRHVDVLKDAGLLTVQQRRVEAARNLPNLWTLHDGVPPMGGGQVPPVGEAQVPPVGEAQVPPVGEAQNRSNGTDPTSSPRKRGGAQEVPETWTPSVEGVEYAKTRGMPLSSIAGEAEKFRTWHRSRGTKFKRVDLGWQTWVRNWAERQPKPEPKAARSMFGHNAR